MISVVAGLSDTMRVGRGPTTMVSPKSSVLDVARNGESFRAHAMPRATRAGTNILLCKTGILLEEERPQRQCAECRRVDRHQRLPRGSEVVARVRVVSWLRAASLTFPVFQTSGVTSAR